MSKKQYPKWNPKAKRYINPKTKRFVKSVKGGMGKRK